REMAVNLGVNPNTVTRSYQTLQDKGIIENRRGIGYFVANTARGEIMNDMKKQFIGDELPRLFRMMKKMGIRIEELVSLYESFDEEASA
ncbi:MAG: GntR family transcriptional regulator, partial [Spirochaetaceae bacterium]|nr:GntR family transcriptional regulator [Spirochaetaceae bacterium]